MQKLSVIILTKNEETVIRRAINSVRSIADEIIVVDTHSEDRTAEIAEEAGARVFKQDWLGWVSQRRTGAGLAENDWVFFIDADEIVSPELAKSIIDQMAKSPSPDTGFVVQREDEFLGRLTFNIRRASKRASLVRLYNRTRSDWKSEVIIHEEVHCTGELVRLEGKLIHWRNYTIGKQLATYNRNSDLEAKVIVANGARSLSLLLVMKPLLRFLWVYIRCGHWRLGIRGFIWAWLNATAEFLRLAKAWELHFITPVLNPPGDTDFDEHQVLHFSDANSAKEHLISSGFQQVTFVWRKGNLRARLEAKGDAGVGASVEVWDSTPYHALCREGGKTY